MCLKHEDAFKWKDWMLILAENKFFIEKKKYDEYVYSAFKVIFDEVKKDGYVKDEWPLTAGMSPVLTDRGRVFASLGGYSDEYKRRQNEEAKEVIKSMTKEVALFVISLFEKH